MTLSFPIPRPFGPLNMRDSELVLGARLPGALVSVLNLDYYEDGLKTREGYTAYSPALSPGKPVTNLHRYGKKDQSEFLLAVCGTDLFKEAGAPGTFVSIRGGLSDGRRWDFVTLADLCIGLNGASADALKFDGQTVHPLALSPPASEPAVSAAGAGALSGDYRYRVTFVSKWGAETNPGPASTAFSAANQAVALSGIPLGSSDIASRRIYRTTAGGGAFFLLDEIADNVTTVYTDNTTDVNLGTDEAPLNHDPPPNGEILAVWKAYLWTVDPARPTRVYHSHQGYPEIYNTDEALGYYVEAGLDDGEAVIGLKPLGSALYVFKENSTWPVTGNLPDDFRVAPEPLNGSIGLYHRSIQKLPDGSLVGLHRSGVYLFTGYQYVKLSDRPYDSVQKLVDGLNPNRLADAAGFYDAGRDRYLLAVTESGYGYNNKILVWDRLRDRWTVYDLKANGMVRWADQLLFASSQGDGLVHRMGGLNDNGSAIAVQAAFPWWGLWDAEALKLVKAVQLDVTAQGDYRPTLGVYLNGESRSFGVRLDEGSSWGSGRWRLDGDTYRIKRTLQVNRKGVAYLKLAFSHGGLDQPLTLNGISVLGAPSGRVAV